MDVQVKDRALVVWTTMKRCETNILFFFFLQKTNLWRNFHFMHGKGVVFFTFHRCFNYFRRLSGWRFTLLHYYGLGTGS